MTAATPRLLLAARPRASIYLSDAPEGRVVVKLLHALDPSPRDLLGFDNALDVTGSLEIAGIERVLRRDRIDGRHALVAVHVDGEPIDRWAARAGRAVADVVRIAIGVAHTLAELHERRVIHKDVKPGHLLVDAESRRVTLIDFAIAARVDHRTPHVGRAESLEGTLAYMSPEQTGRVHRFVDARTDLYSFGATLFELLTGRPPFEASDAIELVHSHLAKLPPAPHALDPRIPVALSNLVLKLLAKDPDDRYQSAFGLEHDLERILGDLERTGGAPGFTLGERDFSARFQIPPKLYGRGAELGVLRRALEDACAGPRAWLVLAGDAGTGKSALVDELRGPIAELRGVLAQGKFDQLQRSTPYLALARAFAELVDALLTEGDDALATTRQRIAAEVGTAADALAAIVPSIAHLTGPPGAPVALGGAEAQRRLHHAARGLLRACATGDRPVALFLDDLQWADPASLALLEQLVTDAELRHVMILGAFRPAEVGAEHPLRAMIAAAGAAGAAATRVDLPLLGAAEVEALLGDALHAPRSAVGELAQRVFDKTAGNPFFVRQFLHTVWERGAVWLDRARGRWTWSLEQIRALDITDNVVELMAANIRSLPAEAQRVVQLAACIGNRFDVEMLARVADRPIADVTRQVWSALEHGLLEPLGEAYRLRASSVALSPHSAELSFVHDRVQQAAYSLIEDGSRAAVHHEIGRLLLARTPADQRSEALFDIVDHLNRAGDHVCDRAERRELAELNAAAGRAARASAAYAQALAYFRAGIARLPADAWTGDHALAVALHGDAAEAAYLAGDYDAALRLGRLVLERGSDPLDKLGAYDALLGTEMARDDLAAVLRVAVAALRELGVGFPDDPGMPHVVLALARTKLALAGRSIESLADLPEMRDLRVRAAMRLIERAIPAAFRSGSKLFPLFVFRLVNLSLAHGNMAVSCFGYAAYAITLCGVLGDFDAGYRFGELALKLVDRLGAEAFRPQVLFIMNNFVRHWKQPLRASLDGLARATRVGLETGNRFEAVWSCYYRLLWSFQCGEPLASVERGLTEHAAFLASDDGARNLAALLRQVGFELARDPPGSGRFAGPHYDETEARGRFASSSDATEVAAFHILKLELAVVFGDARAGVTLADEAARHGEAILGRPSVGLLQFLGALARLARYRETRDRALLRAAAKAAGKLRGWAKHSPDHHGRRALLVEAELASVRGRAARATALYDHAIDAARRAGAIHEEALACELASAHHAALGNAIVAQALRRHAIGAYREWGAIAKLRALEPASEPAGPAQAAEHPIDLASVMKASFAITSELDLDRLLARLVEIAIENAGAETGALILVEAGEWVVEAVGAASRPATVVRVALASAQGICEPVVRWVARAGDPFVAADAANQGPFRHNADLRARGVRSILCAPIKRQGSLVGVLYLENGLTTGAFTRDRIDVLDLLAAQAAIALENARLFDAHKRFVPHEFLQSLGRERIVDVRLGDSVEKEMSILFSDIRAFTSHVERNRPGQNIDFINEYLRHMEPAIVRCGGFIDSYIGDAIMALFDGEADRAIRAGIAMLRALGELNRDRDARAEAAIRIGIGVNTGSLTLGTIGGGGRIKCGVIGDSVNLAARVEELTKTYEVPLLVSEHTIARLRTRFDAREIDRVRVAGKTEAVVLHEIYDADPAPLRDAKLATDALWTEARARYYARDFAGAVRAFEACAAALPADAAARIFLARSRDHAQGGVPDDWTGVEDLRSKRPRLALPTAG